MRSREAARLERMLRKIRVSCKIAKIAGIIAERKIRKEIRRRLVYAGFFLVNESQRLVKG